MAHDGVDGLPRLPGELREPGGPCVLVLHRHERDVHADHPPEPWPPHPRAGYDELRINAPPVRLDGAHTTIPDLDAGNFGLAVERRAELPSQPGHRLARPDGFGDAVRRDVEATPDPAFIQERYFLHALLGRDEFGFEPPRGCEPVFALEILPPLPGLGDLYAPHLVAARLAVQLELHVAPDAVSGQVGHRLGRIGLEHESGSVRSGPTRLEKRPLIQDHYVPQTETAQMLGDAATDDPGPNDHNPRTTLHTLPPKTPPYDGCHTDAVEVCCA